MWALDHSEHWASKNRYFQIVVLEKKLDSPLYWKIKSVIPKGNQLGVLTGRTVAEAEADTKSQFIGKDPSAEKDWRQKAKWMAEDELVR